MALDLLNDALRLAESYVSQAKAASMVPGPLGMIGGSSMALARKSQVNHHAEQYRHYTGWTYAILRIIAQRIAGQKICMARSVNAAAKAWANGVSTKTKQPLAQWKHNLPSFLKSQASDLEPLEDHAFLHTIKNPNPIMVQWSLIFVSVVSLELTGKSYWWLYTNPDGKLEIWPLPSSWVEPLHSDQALFEAWEVRPDGMATSMTLPGRDVIMMGYPDPANPLNNVSPLQANARAVVSDEAIQESQRRSFNNGLNFGMAVVVGRHPDVGNVAGQRPVLTEVQRKQLITSIKQQYRGVVNNDEPLILDGMIEDVRKVTMAPREMDFLNSAQLSKERLTQGWGVNPVSMGQLEGANRASSATADDHLAANVINPKMVLIGQTLTVAVRRHYADETLELFFEEAHAIDPDYELSVSTALYDRSAMSRNELRAKFHMPPIEEGDLAIVGGMEIPIMHEEQQQRSISIPHGEDSSKSNVTCWAKALSSKELRRLFVKQHHRGERAMARELRNVLMDIGEEVVQNIQAAAARNEPITSTTVLSLQSDAWEDRIKTVAYEHLSRMAVNGALLEWQLFVPRFRDTGKVVVKALPGTLANMAQELPDSVREAIGQFTDNLLQQPYWKDLTENVRADLAESIRKGVEAGDSGADIAQRVKTVLGPTGSSTRAYRIARTEVTGALNAGSAVTRTELAEAGLLTGKRWLSISDGSTRAEHKHANGQRVQPDEDFTVGGEKCSYPGDVKLSAKQRCNCRCTTVSVSALDD